MRMSEDALIRLSNLKALGYGPSELVKNVGSSYQYWRDLLAGNKSFGEKAARNIEEKLGLSRGQLDLVILDEAHHVSAASGLRIGTPLSNIGASIIGFTATPRLKMNPNKPDELVIPQFDTGGAMGSGLLLRDQPGEIRGWTVSQEWLAKNIKSHTGPANLCIVTGFGDSMKGMFNSGDPLVIDRGVTAVEGDAVYFFRVENEGFIKRLQRVPGKGLVVLSENKKYESWVVDKSMDFEVFGRVVKAWQGEDF
jgi:hypothetical protein